MNTCYFSKRCRFCQGFLEELAKTPFAKEVRLICVDPSPSRPPLPAWLKVVPTLILGNGEDPKIGPTAVNNWLFERRLMQNQGAKSPAVSSVPAAPMVSSKPRENLQVPSYNPEITMRPTPTSGGAVSSQQPAADSGGEIAAWHDAEMAGNHWSDSYSFVGDAYGGEESKKVVNPIVRNFELLMAAPSNGSPAIAAGTAASAKQSEKSQRLQRDFEAYAASRDTEFAPTRRIG